MIFLAAASFLRATDTGPRAGRPDSSCIVQDFICKLHVPDAPAVRVVLVQGPEPRLWTHPHGLFCPLDNEETLNYIKNLTDHLENKQHYAST